MDCNGRVTVPKRAGRYGLRRFTGHSAGFCQVRQSRRATTRTTGACTMSKTKLIRLVLLTGGTMLALGSCSTSGWLPWVVGAGALAWFRQQSG